MKLTSVQERTLNSIKGGTVIYVTGGNKNGYIFSYDAVDTRNRLYLTTTMRSLFKKGLVAVDFIQDLPEDCIGVVSLVEEAG